MAQLLKNGNVVMGKDVIGTITFEEGVFVGRSKTKMVRRADLNEVLRWFNLI